MSARAGRALLLLPLGLASAALGPPPAAADRGESTLSVDVSFASFAISDQDGLGGALGVDYERGLSDAFWLRAAAGGAYYRRDEGGAYAGSGAVGLTYVVDVVKYVPYLSVGLGAVFLDGAAIDGELHPTVEIGIGLDFLTRRGLSYGAFARFGSFLEDSSFFTAGLRMTWRWGLF